MPRPEKVQAVAEIKERLEQAQAVFLAEYAGLSVKEQQTLRRGLREGGAEFKVLKMTLARRAAAVAIFGSSVVAVFSLGAPLCVPTDGPFSRPRAIRIARATGISVAVVADLPESHVENAVATSGGRAVRIARRGVDAAIVAFFAQAGIDVAVTAARFCAARP